MISLFVLFVLFQILQQHSVLVYAQPVISPGTTTSVTPVVDAATNDRTSAFRGMTIMVSDPVQIHAPAMETTVLQSNSNPEYGGPFETITNSEGNPSPSDNTDDNRSVVILVCVVCIMCVVLAIGFFAVVFELWPRYLKKRRKNANRTSKHKEHKKFWRGGGRLNLPSFTEPGNSSKSLPAAHVKTGLTKPCSPFDCLPHQTKNTTSTNLQYPAGSWQPSRDKSYEIELYSPSIYSNNRGCRSRSSSSMSDSAWTDCSVTEAGTSDTSIYTSQEPLPAHPFLATTTKTNETLESQGYVERRVKQLNQRATTLSLKPIQVPWLQPEILSPKETTKTMQYRGMTGTNLI